MMVTKKTQRPVVKHVVKPVVKHVEKLVEPVESLVEPVETIVEGDIEDIQELMDAIATFHQTVGQISKVQSSLILKHDSKIDFIFAAGLVIVVFNIIVAGILFSKGIL